MPSPYFKELIAAAADIAARALDDHQMIADLGNLDAEVMGVVVLATGDREFPDSWRQRVLTLAARWALGWPRELPANFHAVQRARAERASPLLVELAAAFDQLAAEGLRARFGPLTADPLAIVQRRDAYDRQRAGASAAP